MNGKEVYKFATREVPKVLQEALDDANMTVDQVDWLLLHQANIRIMEVVAQRLGIPMDKVITNLSDYGNTSAASIPLALDEAVRSGKVQKGDVIACAGFGAGPQRAIERLERLGIVKQSGDAKRDRVYCAKALLDILEEPARLKPTE